MKQLDSKSHFAQRSRLKKGVPLIFAACFGLIMLAIGLSQIFAASSVVFLMQPYSQTANANETKSVTVSLNTSGQQVDGGSVRITYDPAQLSDIAFTEPSGSGVTISNKVSTSGRFSYSFQISSGSQNNPSLGTFSFKANALGSTQAAYIRFDAANTSAYQGSAAYQAAYGQAAIVIYAGSPASTTPTNPNPPVSNSNPASSTPASNSSSPRATPSTTAPSPTSNPSSNLNNVPGSESDQPVILSSSEPNTNVLTQSKKKRIPPGAYILIGASLLMFGGVAFIYRKYVRDQPDDHHFLQDLHVGLFDDRPETPAEEVVIAPAATSAKTAASEKPAPVAAAIPKQHPTIITKAKEKIHSREPAKAEVKPKSPHTHPAAPATAPDHKTEPKASPKKPLPEHKSAPSHSPTAKTITPLAAPAVSTHAKPLAPLHPPAPSPPPLMPPRAHEAPSATAAHVPAKAAPSPNPGHIVPEWQAQLKVPHAVPKDDPPDMFELAAEHPESFGSSQLYEVETKEKENDEKPKK